MSQSFKLKYDQMREGNPTKQEPIFEGSKQVEEFYSEVGPVRNICFVWPNGKRIFLNYNYLISGDYAPDQGAITLTFTSQVIVLNGVNLEVLFYDIMQQLSRQVVSTDARYNIIGEGEKFVVNEIIQKT